MHPNTRRIVAICAGLALWSVPCAVSADDWKSRAASQALLQRMESEQADAIAARDPEDPTRFIAALRVPGQLLVVSAMHPSTDLVAARLERGEYRNIYMDLQATPRQDTKFFVHDLNADGLEMGGRGEATDTIYEGRDSLSCDGQWKTTTLKEDEYRQRLADADARYARLLAVLAGHRSAAESSR